MPSTILSSALSAPSLTVTSDVTGINLAASLKVVRVGIKLTSRIMRHKLETGNTIADARIIQPIRVTIDCYAPTIDDMALVNAALLDRSGTYTVKSKGLVFKLMMAQDEVIKQTPEVISASPIRLVFQQQLNPSGQNVQAMSQAADTSLVDQGIQTITSGVQQVQGLASDIQSTVQGLAKQVISNLKLAGT